MVAFLAVAVGVAGHVEPVASPALAVVSTAKQPIDERRLRGLRVALAGRAELADFLGGRRQTDEIERRAADEFAGIRPGRRRDLGRFQPRQDEPVDRRAAPAEFLHGWFGDSLQRLKRPVVSGLLGSRVEHVGPVRPGGPLIDPGAQEADFFGGQRFSLGRHDLLFIDRGDEVDQAAVGAVAWNEHRPVNSPFARTLPHPQIEAAVFVARRVAFEAALLEERLHVFDEIDGSRGGRREQRRIIHGGRHALPNSCGPLLRRSRPVHKSPPGAALPARDGRPSIR